MLFYAHSFVFLSVTLPRTFTILIVCSAITARPAELSWQRIIRKWEILTSHILTIIESTAILVPRRANGQFLLQIGIWVQNTKDQMEGCVLGRRIVSSAYVECT
jgi:hypothetical protein